jgi:hypothetical protein
VGGGSAAVTVTHFQQRGFVLKTKKGAHRSSKTAEVEKKGEDIPEQKYLIIDFETKYSSSVGAA